MIADYLQGKQNGVPQKDIKFVPVTVSYDKVVEG